MSDFRFVFSHFHVNPAFTCKATCKHNARALVGPLVPALLRCTYKPSRTSQAFHDFMPDVLELVCTHLLILLLDPSTSPNCPRVSKGKIGSFFLKTWKLTLFRHLLMWTLMPLWIKPTAKLHTICFVYFGFRDYRPRGNMSEFRKMCSVRKGKSQCALFFHSCLFWSLPFFLGASHSLDNWG